jgi:hypothetical protein
MTKFQTAQENPYSPNYPADHASWGSNMPRRGYFDFDVAAIVQLHEEPEPDYIDTFASSSIDPETALIMKEELRYEMPAYECVERAINESEPTTNNIESIEYKTASARWWSSYTEAKTTMRKMNRHVYVYDSIQHRFIKRSK